MTESELKTATAEILLLGWKDDQGNKIVMQDEMDHVEVIKAIVPFLQKSDYFTADTTKVLAELGWTREQAPGNEKEEEEFIPEPIKETTILQDVENCDKLRELKEIALSEPQFKSIRGRLSSYDLDSLKMEMIRILTDVPAKLHKKLEDTPVNKVVQNFEEDKPAYVKKLEEVKDIAKTETDTGELIDMPDIEDLVGHGIRDINDIITRKPFNDLFTIKQNILDAVKLSMEDNGFDPAFPIILWKNTVIDGHTRLKAALFCGIKEVPVLQKEFTDEHEALEYAMHNQRDRRNISEAELLKCISVIDTPMPKVDASAKRGEKIVPSHVKTAETLGVGQSVVTDARTVLKDEVATEEVKEGKKTLREAAKGVRDAKRKPKEKKLKTLTRIEAVVQVLRDNAGNDIETASLVKESDKVFGGDEDIAQIESMVDFVLEVLVALNLVKVTDDIVSVKKGIR